MKGREEREEREKKNGRKGRGGIDTERGEGGERRKDPAGGEETVAYCVAPSSS